MNSKRSKVKLNNAKYAEEAAAKKMFVAYVVSNLI